MRCCIFVFQKDAAPVVFFGVNQNIADFERDQYQPEYAETYELGLKSMWMDNRLRFNLTLFQNGFDDKQESFVKPDNSTGTVATLFENAASVTCKGGEVEVEYAVTEGLRLFLNYGYLDAEYDEFNLDITPTDNIDNVVDGTFLTPGNAPEFTVGYGFNFTQ
jgi:iron complex outermembrane receptor protein